MTKNIDEQLPFHNWIFVCHRKHPPQPHSHFFFLFLIYLFLIGGGIALQYCAGFYHTSTWISQSYTYVPTLLNLPPTSHPIPPLELVSEHQIWVSSVTQQIPTGCLILHMVMSVSVLLSAFVPPSLSPSVFTSPLSYVCISIAIRVISNEVDEPRAYYTDWSK